jgi:hypothetical protein
LTLLIHTQHDGLLGRVQVQADHVGHFFQELRVARQLESLHPVRLQLVGLPDVVDGGLNSRLDSGPSCGNANASCLRAWFAGSHPLCPTRFSMSGYTYGELVKHGIQAGAGDYLGKPFTHTMLLSRVQETLAEAA